MKAQGRCHLQEGVSFGMSRSCSSSVECNIGLLQLFLVHYIFEPKSLLEVIDLFRSSFNANTVSLSTLRLCFCIMLDLQQF